MLVRLQRALEQIYRSRIERAVLFGTRARGDAHAESDYDIPHAAPAGWLAD